jgi:hypothetical protein
MLEAHEEDNKHESVIQLLASFTSPRACMTPGNARYVFALALATSTTVYGEGFSKLALNYVAFHRACCASRLCAA